MENLKKICRGIIAGTIGLGIFFLSNITIPAYIALKIQESQEKRLIEKALKRNDSFFDSSIPLESVSNNQLGLEARIPNLFEKKSVKKLEEIVGEESNPAQLNFSLDENVLLGRLIPIKSIIEEQSDFYGVDPLWFTQILSAESFLFPLAYNEITKDYGLAQTNISRYEHAKMIILDPGSRYYSPESFVDNIYNPKTNLIATLSLVKENMDKFKLKKEDLEILSVLYNSGPAGFSDTGEFSKDAKDYLKYVNKFNPIIEKIVQCFKFTKEEKEKITNPLTKEILSLYDENISTREAYGDLFSFYMVKMDKKITSENLWERAVATKEAFFYFRIMKEIYGENNSSELEKIAKSASSLKDYVKDYPKTELHSYVYGLSNSIKEKMEDYKLEGSANE